MIEKLFQHKKISFFMLSLLIVPLLFNFSSLFVSLSGTNNSPIVYAASNTKAKNSGKDKANDKDSKNDKGDSSSDSSNGQGGSSNSSSGNDKSAWNSALSTLSQSAVGSGKSGDNSSKASGSGDAGDQQADIKQMTQSGNYLNAWGFMGSGNTDLWEKNNNSSYTASYSSLVQGGTGSDQLDNSYKQAARFAYSMQAAGLDQPVKSGFNSGSNWIQTIAGWAMQLSYFVLKFAQNLFKVILSFLKAINPISWAIYGTQNMSKDNPLYSVVSFFHKLSNILYGFGELMMLLCLTVAIGFIGLGISIGGSGHSQKTAAINTFMSYMKRLFVATMMPILALSAFYMTIDMAENAFTTQQTSVPNYAVYGSLIDYNDWAMNSRLGLPSDVSLPTSFSSNKVPSLTHNQILSINYKGAGISGLGGLYKLTSNDNTSSQTAINPDNASSSDNTDLNDSGTTLLGSWMSGNTITAADFASSQDAGIRQAALDKSKDKSSNPNISNELVKAKYNGYDGNATNYITNYTNSGLIKGNTDNSPNVVYHDGQGFPGDSANGAKPGGLSTLGMYTYMLTTASNNNMSIGDTDQLANDVAQPAHKSVVLVGNGIVSTGNLLWGFGMMIGLTMLIVGYLLEVIRTIKQSITGTLIGTTMSMLHSIRGGVQLASVVTGMFLGVLATAIMYQFAQLTFIGLAEFSDQVLVQHVGSVFSGAVTNFSLHSQTSIAMLSSSASMTTVGAVMNMIYGLFLLWLAIWLLRLKVYVVASLTSIVEEVANRFMATMANATGISSAGTRQMISRSATTNNSSSQLMSGIGKTAATGMIMTGGVGAAGAGLKNAMGAIGGKNNTPKGKDSSAPSNNNGFSLINTSAGKQGNASQSLERVNNNGKSNNNDQRNNSDNKLQNDRDKELNNNKLSSANSDKDKQFDHSQNNQLDTTSGSNDLSSGNGNIEDTSASLQSADANQIGDDSGNVSNNQPDSSMNSNDNSLSNSSSSNNSSSNNSNLNNSGDLSSDDTSKFDGQDKGNANNLSNPALNPQNVDSIGSSAKQDNLASSTDKNDNAASNLVKDHGTAMDNNDQNANKLLHNQNNNQTNSPYSNKDSKTAANKTAETQRQLRNGDNNANNLNSQQHTLRNAGDNNAQKNAAQQAQQGIGSDANSNNLTSNDRDDNSLQNAGQNSMDDNSLQNAGQNSMNDSALQNNDQNSMDDNSLQNNDQNSMDDNSLQNAGQNSMNDSSLQNNGQNSMNDSALQNAGQNSMNNGSLQNGGQNSMNNNSLQNGGQNSMNNNSLQNGGQNSMNNNSLQNGGQNSMNNNSSSSVLGASSNALNSIGNNVNQNQSSSSLGNNLSGGKANSLPVNKEIKPSQIQSQMNGLQTANSRYSSANSLAQANPNNQTLKQNAMQAKSNLSGLQNNVIGDYNQQPIANNMVQSGWLQNPSAGKNISVGAANNAVGSIYQAQQSLNSAQSRYGSNAPQFKQAQQQLNSAKDAGSNLGLSSSLMNDTDAISNANTQIHNATSDLMSGTWKPDSSIAHIGASKDRTIGI